MAEFGFFVLGAVVGVPAAIVGLGVYVSEYQGLQVRWVSFCFCELLKFSIIIL